MTACVISSTRRRPPRYAPPVASAAAGTRALRSAGLHCCSVTSRSGAATCPCPCPCRGGNATLCKGLRVAPHCSSSLAGPASAKYHATASPLKMAGVAAGSLRWCPHSTTVSLCHYCIVWPHRILAPLLKRPSVPPRPTRHLPCSGTYHSTDPRYLTGFGGIAALCVHGPSASALVATNFGVRAL